MSTQPRRLRLLAALTLVAMLIAPFAGFVAPGRASAATPRLTLSKSSALPGASVTASGSAFPKHAKGQLVWAADGTVLTSFTTSSSGSFRASFRVPNAAPDSYIVAANVSAGSSGQAGSTSLVSATANLRVSATATPTKTPVPPTATETPTEVPPTATKAPTKTPTKAPTKTPVPPTATETPTAAPTDTPTPTDTPLPTATSTQTPVPTDTPTETATATGAPSATATSTKTATSTPTKTATTAPSNGLKLSPGQIGVNLAGAEFTDTSVPGTYNSDYTYPTASEYDYYASKGLTLIRLPFRWERIQPVLGAPLDPTELSRLDQQVAYASARGMRLILDVHNYARYRVPNGSGGVNTYIIGDSDGVVTVSDFQDLWTRLAAHFAGTSTIWAYDLMNEPHDMGATSWATIAQAAVNAIRQVDSGHTILVPGDCWSGAWTWANCNSGLILSDPAGNLVYEAHQYFDRDGSGTYANSYDTDGATATTGADRLKPFANWLAANGLRGYIGEFGAPNSDPRWQTVLDNFLGAMASDHLMGTAWSGGPWWGSTYKLRLDPVNGADEPSLKTIVARLG